MSLHNPRSPDALNLEASWGEPAPGVGLIDSHGRVVHDKHDAYDSGDPMWSAVTGFVGGALGGVAMVATAEGVSRVQHLGVDFFALAGKAAHQFPGFALASDHTAGALFAAFVGAVVGGSLGWLSRRATRILPRVIFFATFLPAVWLLVQAFVILPLSPWSATLPAAPWLAGALVYGVFLALAPPIVKKDALVETPDYR